MIARRPGWFFFCASISLLAAGCAKEHPIISSIAETDEPQYQAGEQFFKADHPDDALTAFQSVIKGRQDDAPESHLEMGRIYLTAKKDPISAIYHFKAYLAAKPTSDQAPMVAELINTAEKDFARMLPGGPNSFSESDMLDQIKGLQTENENLRHQLATGATGRVTGVSLDSIPQATGPSISPVTTKTIVTQMPVATTHVYTPASATVTAARAPTAPPSGRIYTVESGDTLSSISLKVLGSRSRWLEIYNANRDQLPKPESTLHVGEVLKLPAQ